MLGQFEALRTVIAFGQVGSQPTAVRSAQDLLETNDAKPFKVSLVNSVLGNTIWVEAASLGAAGALDEHSEELFARGSAVFQLDQFPKSAVETKWNNINLDEACRGQICDLLNEALRDVLEAFQQWSQSGVEGSIAELQSFFQNFASCLQVLNWCEWAVLIKTMSSIPGVLSFMNDKAVPHGQPLSDEAQAYLSATQLINFQRGPLLDLLSRVDDARDRMNKLCEVASDLGPCCESIMTGALPTILAHSKLRTQIFTELTSVCSVLRLSGSTSYSALVADFHENNEKSLLGLACSIVQARGTYEAIELDTFDLMAKTEAGDVHVLDSGELDSFLKVILEGLPVSTTIVDQYLQKTVAAVQDAWV